MKWIKLSPHQWLNLALVAHIQDDEEGGYIDVHYATEQHWRLSSVQFTGKERKALLAYLRAQLAQ